MCCNCCGILERNLNINININFNDNTEDKYIATAIAGCGFPAVR
jgi:hypothetical protein